jgi:hypothetical protein
VEQVLDRDRDLNVIVQQDRDESRLARDASDDRHVKLLPYTGLRQGHIGQDAEHRVGLPDALIEDPLRQRLTTPSSHMSNQTCTPLVSSWLANSRTKHSLSSLRD